MDSVQLTSPRAQFYSRSLKREEAAQGFDRLTWSDPELAGEVATELSRGVGERKTFGALTAILEKGREAIDDHFRPHAAELVRATSRHGVREGGAKFYASLLERFPEQVSPDVLVREVLPNEGSLHLALDHLEQHPEWSRSVADGILAQQDPSLDALQALARSADASHRDALSARVSQPGALSPTFFYAVAALGRAGLGGMRQELLQRILHSGEDLRRLYGPDVMAHKGASSAYAALLDPETTERLLSRIEKAGPFDQMAPPDQVALCLLGSVELAPEHEARWEKLCQGEIRGNHGWGPLDGVVDRYRTRYQNQCLRAIREGDDPVGSTRAYLGTFVDRVIPSSLEFQTRTGIELLKSRLGEDAPRVGAELLSEFQRDPSAQDALWLAHCLEAPGLREALAPHLASPPTGGPLELLTSAARRELIAGVMNELLAAPLDASRGLVERLLVLKKGSESEVYEAWSECLPENHWARDYSQNPRERYEAAFCDDPVFHELRSRLREHGPTMTAYREFERLLESGLSRQEARDRALLGYLVPGAPRPTQQLEVRPDGVQVGSVRLRRKS